MSRSIAWLSLNDCRGCGSVVETSVCACLFISLRSSLLPTQALCHIAWSALGTIRTSMCRSGQPLGLMSSSTLSARRCFSLKSSPACHKLAAAKPRAPTPPSDALSPTTPEEKQADSFGCPAESRSTAPD
jgi:hypothetical protein